MKELNTFTRETPQQMQQLYADLYDESGRIRKNTESAYYLNKDDPNVVAEYNRLQNVISNVYEAIGQAGPKKLVSDGKKLNTLLK